VGIRKIIKIDEEKCDGCGQCVPACAEGALQVIDGKARLVSETYCDGLGACLGECSQNAIFIEEREAKDFDTMETKKPLTNLNSMGKEEPEFEMPTSLPHASCPGSLSRQIRTLDSTPARSRTGSPAGELSRLTNWPVQLTLAPVNAPYFRNAKLLISADCVPFAACNFHDRFLEGRVLLVGCPKLDNMEFYRNKLTDILNKNKIQSIDIAYMEVPCCFGLVVLVKMALENSGKNIPVTLRKLGIDGEITEETTIF